MAEWLKATVLKTVSPERARGFESHSLRQPCQVPRPTPMKTALVLSAAILLIAAGPAALAATPPPPLARAELASRVRDEMLFSWRAYEKYAWGHDELRAVSRTPRDRHAASLLMTPVDALDTLLLMGFTEEADKARALILEK